MAPPRLMNSGPTAIAAIPQVMQHAMPVTVNTALGPVTLKPGAVWGGNKLLFYPAMLYVWYAVDDRLYEWGTGDFVRDEWLNAMSEGARRAAHWEAIGQAEFALLTGIFVPWYLLLGVSVAKAAAFYYDHKGPMNKAMELAPRVINGLIALHDRYPTLFNKMASRGAKELLVNLPKGVTAEDVCFFIGRVIKGGAAAPELTFGAAVKMITVTLALVTAAHLPGIAVHGAKSALSTKAVEYRTKLREAGYEVSDEEIRLMIRDFEARPDTKQFFEQLEKDGKALKPVLDELAKSLKSGK
ncbi:MAG TPA: hypothetical protein VFK05_28155 [Polyangiaceae bacterium]|nr:hypothetical protein [Polyangiaceae bacterium]